LFVNRDLINNPSPGPLTYGSDKLILKRRPYSCTFGNAKKNKIFFDFMIPNGLCSPGPNAYKINYDSVEKNPTVCKFNKSKFDRLSNMIPNSKKSTPGPSDYNACKLVVINGPFSKNKNISSISLRQNQNKESSLKQLLKRQPQSIKSILSTCTGGNSNLDSNRIFSRYIYFKSNT
jgi:hypothetical protein